MDRIRLGDRVQIVRGKKKGTRGVIKKLLRKQGRVIVDGVNMVKKHQKPVRQGEKGKIIEIEAPIALSNVMPIDPKTDRPTRVRFEKQANGEKQRLAKSGEALIAERKEKNS